MRLLHIDESTSVAIEFETKNGTLRTHSAVGSIPSSKVLAPSRAGKLAHLMLFRTKTQ
jgi:hypothetical protein